MDVGIYLRISSDRAGEGLGVARQEQDCRALAAARGWTVTERYCDNDRSAYNGKARPDYHRMLHDLGDGTIGGFVAWHPDRAIGPPRELEDLIDLVERTSAVVATVQTGSYDLSSPSGRLVARQLGAASRYEREMKAERHRRKHLELAQAGKVGGGGHRPFGFSCFGAHPERCEVAGCPHDGTLSLIGVEAEHIREAAERIAAGESQRGVLTDWAARGITTSTGGAWLPHSFQRMLTSPRVAGLRQHHGRGFTTEQRRRGLDVIGDAEWPAIVDRSTWEQVRRILLDPDRRTNRSARRYLLTGWAACGPCGAKLVARPRADKRRCYVCSSGVGFTGCGKIRCLADPVEEFVAGAVLAAIDGPGFVDAMRRRRDDNGDDAASELAGVELQLDQADVDHADGTIDRRSWLNLRSRLTGRRDALMARVAARTRTNALTLLDRTADLEGQWERLGFDQRRAVLAVVVDRVTIGSAVRGRNVFDPDRISITWRA